MLFKMNIIILKCFLRIIFTNAYVEMIEESSSELKYPEQSFKRIGVLYSDLFGEPYTGAFNDRDKILGNQQKIIGPNNFENADKKSFTLLVPTRSKMRTAKVTKVSSNVKRSAATTTVKKKYKENSKKFNSQQVDRSKNEKKSKYIADARKAFRKRPKTMSSPITTTTTTKSTTTTTTEQPEDIVFGPLMNDSVARYERMFTAAGEFLPAGAGFTDRGLAFESETNRKLQALNFMVKQKVAQQKAFGHKPYLNNPPARRQSMVMDPSGDFTGMGLKYPPGDGLPFPAYGPPQGRGFGQEPPQTMRITTRKALTLPPDLGGPMPEDYQNAETQGKQPGSPDPNNKNMKPPNGPQPSELPYFKPQPHSEDEGTPDHPPNDGLGPPKNGGVAPGFDQDGMATPSGENYESEGSDEEGPNIGRGGPDYGPGRPNFGQGRPDYGPGGPNFGQGGPNFGQGVPNFGQGGPNFGQSGPIFGQSGPNFGKSFEPGRPNFGQGEPNFGQGGPSFGQGGPDFGSGGQFFGLGGPDIGPVDQNFVQGGPNFGPGHPNFGPHSANSGNHGPKNIPGGANLGRPDFAQIEPNFGPKGYNIGSNGANFIQGASNFEPGGANLNPGSGNFQPMIRPNGADFGPDANLNFKPRGTNFRPSGLMYGPGPNSDQGRPNFMPSEFSFRGPNFKPNGPQLGAGGPNFIPGGANFGPGDPNIASGGPNFVSPSGHNFVPDGPDESEADPGIPGSIGMRFPFLNSHPIQRPRFGGSEFGPRETDAPKADPGLPTLAPGPNLPPKQPRSEWMSNFQLNPPVTQHPGNLNSIGAAQNSINQPSFNSIGQPPGSLFRQPPVSLYGQPPGNVMSAPPKSILTGQPGVNSVGQPIDSFYLSSRGSEAGPLTRNILMRQPQVNLVQPPVSSMGQTSMQLPGNLMRRPPAVNSGQPSIRIIEQPRVSTIGKPWGNLMGPLPKGQPQSESLLRQTPTIQVREDVSTISTVHFTERPRKRSVNNTDLIPQIPKSREASKATTTFVGMEADDIEPLINTPRKLQKIRQTVTKYQHQHPPVNPTLPMRSDRNAPENPHDDPQLKDLIPEDDGPKAGDLIGFVDPAGVKHGLGQNLGGEDEKTEDNPEIHMQDLPPVQNFNMKKDVKKPEVNPEIPMQDLPPVQDVNMEIYPPNSQEKPAYLELEKKMETIKFYPMEERTAFPETNVKYIGPVLKEVIEKRNVTTTTSRAERLSSLIDAIEYNDNPPPVRQIREDYNHMKLEHSLGIFTGFIFKLLDILLKKNNTDLLALNKAFCQTLSRFLMTDQAQYYGEPFVTHLKKFAAVYQSAAADVLKAPLIISYHALETRRTSLSKDLNSILDYTDGLYNSDDERAMIKLLDDVHKYPNGKKSAHELAARVLTDAIRTPFGRWAFKDERAILLVGLNTYMSDNFGGMIEVVTHPPMLRAGFKSSFRRFTAAMPRINETALNIIHKRSLKRIFNESLAKFRAKFEEFQRAREIKLGGKEVKDFMEDDSSVSSGGQDYIHQKRQKLAEIGTKMELNVGRRFHNNHKRKRKVRGRKRNHKKGHHKHKPKKHKGKHHKRKGRKGRHGHQNLRTQLRDKIEGRDKFENNFEEELMEKGKLFKKGASESPEIMDTDYYLETQERKEHKRHKRHKHTQHKRHGKHKHKGRSRHRIRRRILPSRLLALSNSDEMDFKRSSQAKPSSTAKMGTRSRPLPAKFTFPSTSTKVTITPIPKTRTKHTLPPNVVLRTDNHTRNTTELKKMIIDLLESKYQRQQIVQRMKNLQMNVARNARKSADKSTELRVDWDGSSNEEDSSTSVVKPEKLARIAKRAKSAKNAKSINIPKNSQARRMGFKNTNKRPIKRARKKPNIDTFFDEDNSKYYDKEKYEILHYDAKNMTASAKDLMRRILGRLNGNIIPKINHLMNKYLP